MIFPFNFHFEGFPSRTGYSTWCLEAGAASKVAVPGADLLQQAAGLIQQVVEEIEWIDCCWVTNGGWGEGGPSQGGEIYLLSLWHGLR